MKNILYLMFVAVLALATSPVWGQNTYTLGNIPQGWTVTANGQNVTVSADGTATIPEGAEVLLFPPQAEINLVKSVTLTDAPTTSCRLILLDTVQHNLVAQDCDTLTGTLSANVKISIADGATVTLAGVTINGTNNSAYQWAGITCIGDATITLKDGTINSVKGFDEKYPGIHVPQNKTLVIKGDGSLNASSNNEAAGIGGGWKISCGNIEIQGGIVTAIGGGVAAGIGSGYEASCGTITISGDSVTATGGTSAAGIGSGDEGSCSTITISGGTVTATGGQAAAGIGSGYVSSCGTITISGGTVTATGGQAAAGIGSGYQSSCDTITISGGTINATGGEVAAGIGSGFNTSCSTITISGGTVNATGGEAAAGIGSGTDGSCGNITISGGTVNATGGEAAAGIGSGDDGSCGNITITNGVTSVTAIKGDGAPNSIGAGDGSGTCGTVTIDQSLNDVTVGDTRTISHAPSVPTGAIDGLFSVSSTKQVYFSQGNLRAYNATANSTSGWEWSFAENQWDYIGSSGSNQYINGSMTISKAGYVDLFCWVGTSASYDNYGIMYDNDTQGWAHEGTNFGNSTNDTLKHDWGHNPITNGGNEADIWRTPTNDEWVYLINSRTTAAGTAPTINGTADARYAKAKLFGTNRGLIIFPDTYVHPDGVAYPTGINAAGNTSWNGNQYSAADWAKMEAAGCVFLPCAGIRQYYTQVNDKETRGFYASSTPKPDTWNQAKLMQFLDNSCTPNANRYRRDAGPVRLVQDAN